MDAADISTLDTTRPVQRARGPFGQPVTAGVAVQRAWRVELRVTRQTMPGDVDPEGELTEHQFGMALAEHGPVIESDWMPQTLWLAEADAARAARAALAQERADWAAEHPAAVSIFEAAADGLSHTCGGVVTIAMRVVSVPGPLRVVQD